MEQVAGALPEITVADIMAVGCTPAPEMGMWQYDFSDPEGPQVTDKTTAVTVVVCGGGGGDVVVVSLLVVSGGGGVDSHCRCVLLGLFVFE